MSVTLNFEGSIAHISLDDGKVNAFDLERFETVHHCLDEAEASARAVVISGRPGVFSAGFNIKKLQGDDESLRLQLMVAAGQLVTRIFDAPLPVIAASTGHAMALGAVLLLAVDHRIGERGAYKYGLNETLIGEVLPAWAMGPAMLRIPKSHIMPAMVFSELYGPDDALQAGFLDEVLDSGKAVEAALEYASRLAELPGDAYVGNKRAVRGVAADEARRFLASQQPPLASASA